MSPLRYTPLPQLSKQTTKGQLSSQLLIRDVSLGLLEASLRVLLCSLSLSPWIPGLPAFSCVVFFMLPVPDKITFVPLLKGGIYIFASVIVLQRVLQDNIMI